jgi:HAD superfamily hydrolase (TIGR01549 family)
MVSNIAAAIFDLDETLLDTSALRAARERHDWRAVYERLRDVQTFESPRFGGIAVSALPQLASSRGLKVGLLTHVPESYASELLRAHGIRMDAMVSGSDGYPRKPDPGGLRAVAAELGVEPEDSLYAGDSAADFAAAAAAGMTSVGVAWSGGPQLGWRHGWPDIAIDRPVTLLHYLDGDRELTPLGELLAQGSLPSIHWGSLLRIDERHYALGRYFRPDDQRSSGHQLSRLVLDAKNDPGKDARIAAIFEALAAQVPSRGRPKLIVSVPPAPGGARDRFTTARAVLASRYGARDGGGVLEMRFAVEDYKLAPRGERAALNLDRFVATPLSGETVLLIDDVLTSGSQSAACREALRSAGCGTVTVITLAVAQDKLPEKCPSCGSSLVRRARRSDGSPFFGCTSYPTCRYTRSLVSGQRAQPTRANSEGGSRRTAISEA